MRMCHIVISGLSGSTIFFPHYPFVTILFNLYSECLTKEALEGFGDFKISGQIIHTVKYADDLVLLTKEDKVLQDMIDELTEIG
jgi:hypothetical protein